MYNIPAEYLKVEYNPDTKLPIYVSNGESVNEKIRTMCNVEKLAEFTKSMQTIGQMVTNPFYSELMRSLPENEQCKILRDIVLKDSEKVNAEIRRLLKINPSFIVTDHMKRLMEISATYTGYFQMLAPRENEELMRECKEQRKRDLHQCTNQSQDHSPDISSHHTEQ